MNKTTKTDFYKIDPRSIVVSEGFNSRVDFGDIEELAESIKASKGPIKAISVIPFKDENGEEKYRLVDGERRYRATMLLISQGFDIPRVKAEFVPKNATEEELLLNQIRSNEGKPFNEYELGLAYNKFSEMGLSHKEIAEKLGVARWKVDCFLAHLNRDERVQELMKQGKITGVDVRRIYQASKNEEAAVKEILKLNDRAEKTGKSKISLTDSDIDSAYSVAKDTATIKKGLATLITYIEDYASKGVEPELDIYDILEKMSKEKKSIKDIFEDYKKYHKSA